MSTLPKPPSLAQKVRQTNDRANQTQPASGVVLRHVVLGILASIAFTVIFGRIFDFVKDAGRDVTPFDRSLLFWMYHHRAHWLTVGATFLAHMGSPPVIVGLAAVAAVVGLAWHRVRGAAWTLPIAVVGSGVIIQGVKLLMHRQRPAFFTPLLHEAGYSFPSGHSLIAMVVYGLLGYFALHLCKSRGARLAVRVVTVAVVFLIGVSRVYVGVHFPTDVLAGWTAGVPWLITCLALHEVLARRWPSAGEPVLTPQADKSGDPHSAGSDAKALLRG
jgi:undecaprenyl-diphosphatase